MHVTRTELEDTLETISTAFSHKSLPDDTQLTPEQVDCIRDSLQDAIEAYEDLYKEIREAKIKVNYSELIRTLRHFRNIQMRLRVNKDRFQAQADRFYDAQQGPARARRLPPPRQRDGAPAARRRRELRRDGNARRPAAGHGRRRLELQDRA